MAKLSFKDAIDGWVFCGTSLLQGRIERGRALAVTDNDKAILHNMMSQYWEELDREIAQRTRLGEDMTEQRLVLQQACEDDRYAGLLLYGQYQVMESVAPRNTYYIVDHLLPDLLLREAGPASNIRRFDSIQSAENHINFLKGVETPAKQEIIMPASVVKKTPPARAAKPAKADPQAALATVKPPLPTATVLEMKRPVPEVLKPAKATKAVKAPEPVAPVTPAAKMKKAAPEVVKTQKAAPVVSKAPAAPKKVAPKAPAALAPKAKEIAPKAPPKKAVPPAPAARKTAKVVTTPNDPLAAVRRYSSRKPKASERFRELIMLGTMTDKEIFTKVQKEFGLGDDKFLYLNWHRRDLIRKGFNVPPPKPEKESRK